MKLPAVALAGFFSTGIALSAVFAPKGPLVGRHSLLLLLTATAIAISAGFVLLHLRFIRSAGAVSLGAWLLLGFTAACVAKQPQPPDHVLGLIADGRIDTQAPVRWQGILRDEPAHLPWGTGYELNLDSVARGEEIIAAKGGIRFSLYSKETGDSPPEVHAGDRVEILARAHLPQQFKNPGSFDRRAYLARQDIDLTGTLRDSHLLTKLDSPPPTLWHRLVRLRHTLRERLDSLLSSRPTESAVLRAMLLGDRSFLDRSDTVAFQQNGTYHILVVAGLHVTALVVFVYWVCRRLRLPLPALVFSALFLLIVYVAIVEDRPPIFRAGLMAATVLLGRLLYRRLDLLNSAATAALIILIASPLALTDSSFQLSFLAMGAIGGIGVPLLDRTVEPYLRAFEHLGDDTRDGSYAPRAAQFRIELRWATRLLAARLPARLARFSETMVALPLRFSLRVWELFVISLILQLAMLPLLALYFHRVALAGPVANVPAVTLTTLLVPLGFFTLALSFVWAGLARILAAVLAFATHLLVRMTEWFAAVPHLSYRIPGPRLWLLAGFFALLLVFMAALRLQRRRLLLATLLPLLCAAYGIARCPFPPQFAKGKLEVTILDVGQGDSIFVVSPHGRTMLVDAAGSVAGFGDRTPGAGPDPGEDAVSPYLWSPGFQRVDIVAATHPHQDHIGGLTAVLQNFSVGALWIGREVDNSSLRALKRLAGDKRIPVIHQTRGAIFDWDGVRESTLWPEAPPTDVAPTIKDNDSLVFRLQFHNEGFLLTGDLEKQAEHTLSLENLDDSLRADVLKVGHHGSKNSTTTEFLEAVKPCVAVVSAGEDNPYGHPSAETLDRLADAHVRVFGTQRDGTVRVLTDGTILSVDCFVPCSDRKSDARASAAAPPHESVQDPEH